MAEFNGFTPREAPEVPANPNSGSLNISGLGSFGSLYVSGVVTAVTYYGDGSYLTGVGTVSSQWVTTIAGIHTLSNVGIGTINPTVKLDVAGEIKSRRTNNTFEGGQLTFTRSVDDADAYTIDVYGNTIANARLRFIDVDSTAERMSIDKSGNILIGTGSSTGTASQPLQVNGGVYISNNVGIGATNPGAKLQVDGNVRIGNSNTSNELRFYGIVGDNPGGYNHSAIIERKWGLDDQSELLIFKGNDPDTGTIHDRMRIVACGRIVFHSYNDFADVDTYIGAAGTSNINGSGYFNGNNLTVTGTVTQNSDESLKDNIRTISDGLEKVLKLRGVEFNRKDEEESIQHIGLIAQEVEKIIPEVVTKDMNGLKSVAYSNLVAVLVESIKELNQKVERLTSIVESSTILR